METPPKTLGARFTTAFEASEFDSLTKLSKASACSPSRAAKIASGDFDTSKDGPGAFGLARMAEKMGVTLDDLVPPNKPIVKRPGVHAFFARYNPEAPHIHDFHDILEYCDIYGEPKKGGSNLLSTGRKSLLVEKTEIRDPIIHQIEYESWSPERRARIFEWQRRAWRLGAVAEPESFVGSYVAAARVVKIPILRAACRVLGDDLKFRLLVYCEQIW